jgi:dolichol-phosphate mannosyltransferase
VKCGCKRVVEVPITFQDRLHGQSKLTLKEQLNYLRHLRRLYNYRFGIWAYLAQFLIVGASGMVVDLSAYAVLLLSGVYLHLARALAIWVAMTWNFWLNRTVTFSFAKGKPWWRQYIAFCGSCLVGAVVNWGMSLWLTTNVPFFAAHKLTSAAVGVVAGTLFNFTLCRLVVFQKKD